MASGARLGERRVFAALVPNLRERGRQRTRNSSCIALHTRMNPAQAGKGKDTLNLAGRVAIVTGGSRGIGKAVVELFASLGANTIVNYVKDEDAAASTVNIAQARGVKAMAIQADVARLAEAERLVKETVEHFGRVDFLICNAGIWEGGPVESISEELWNKTFDINLKGAWL